jgi:hypothetical protein
MLGEILTGLSESNYYPLGYEDDTAIVINGNFPRKDSEVLQTALGV